MEIRHSDKGAAVVLCEGPSKLQEPSLLSVSVLEGLAGFQLHMQHQSHLTTWLEIRQVVCRLYLAWVNVGCFRPLILSTRTTDSIAPQSEFVGLRAEVILNIITQLLVTSG
jgi:hypothetical protein